MFISILFCQVNLSMHNLIQFIKSCYLFWCTFTNTRTINLHAIFNLNLSHIDFAKIASNNNYYYYIDTNRLLYIHMYIYLIHIIHFDILHMEISQCVCCVYTTLLRVVVFSNRITPSLAYKVSPDYNQLSSTFVFSLFFKKAIDPHTRTPAKYLLNTPRRAPSHILLQICTRALHREKHWASESSICVYNTVLSSHH